MLSRTTLLAALLVLLLTACSQPGQEARFTIVEPCTPVEGSDLDPCADDGFRIDAFAGGRPPELGDEPGGIGFIDGGTFFATPHFVIRGTFLPDTTRCTFGHPFRLANHNRALLGLAEGVLSYKCFIDVRANEYYIGSGPAQFPVLIMRYPHSASQDSPHARNRLENSFAGWLEGREYVLGLGPAIDVSTEVWQMFGLFKVVRAEDGTVKAHHPGRDQWLAEKPTVAQTHIDRLEMTLPTIASTFGARHNERVEANGGRIGAATTLPMLVTNANNLRTYYEAVGAYDDGHVPAQPPPSCSDVVTNPLENTALMADCSVLLGLKDTLRGTAALNWSVDVAMAEWDGIRIEDGRVTQVLLVEKGLTGTVPAALANLTDLQFLWLNRNDLTGTIPPELGNLPALKGLLLNENDLTGPIPTELGNLANLEVLWLHINQLSGTVPSELAHLSKLKQLALSSNALTGEIPVGLGNLTSLEALLLSDNQFTGCIPPALRSVASNDLDRLGLSDCTG